MRILLAEDDAMIGKAIRQGLADDGHTVDWVRNVSAVNAALHAPVYDLMLLDLGLPGGDGLDILRTMRQRGSALPVIIITARDDVQSRISGLDSGADDYVLKPFDLDELAARMRAVLRRRDQRPHPGLQCGDLKLEPREKTASISGKPLTLSAREFALLQALLERQDRFLSRSQLEEALYGWDDDIDSNVIEVYLHRLRRKIGSERIINLRGIGYRLKP